MSRLAERPQAAAALEAALLAAVVLVVTFWVLNNAVAAVIIAGVTGLSVDAVRRVRDRSAAARS